MLAAPLLLIAAVRTGVSRREWRALLRDGWFLLGVVALALADRWVFGFPSKDVLFLQREFAADAALLAQPFVSTATGLGKPVLGHPLSALVYPFGFTNLLPLSGLAVHLNVALHTLLGAVGWWLLLASHPGARRGTRGRWWIRTGVLVATLNGFVIARLGGQQGIEYALAAAWLPLALYAIQEIVRGRRRQLPHVVLLALAGAASVTLCPNLAVGVVLTSAAYVGACLAAAARLRRPIATTALVGARLLGAGALALLLALPELVPTIDLLARNDGFTYRFDEHSYRFRPYSLRELRGVLVGFTELDFGRTQIARPSTWGLLFVGSALAWRPRAGAVGAALVFLALCLDWAMHGYAYDLVVAALPGFERISIAPTIEALLLWGLIGLWAALTAPGRATRIASPLLALALVASLGLASRVHRLQPAYEPQREAALFVWTAGLPAGSLVACVQPVTERAYLLPDPIARERGVRTIGEDWYSVLPMPFYASLPDVLRDGEALAALDATHVVSVESDPPAGGSWRLLADHDALALAARPAAERSLFRLCMRLMKDERPAWDGHVRVYERRSDGPPPARVGPPPALLAPPSPAGWPALGWLLPVITLLLLPGLRGPRASPARAVVRTTA